MAIILKSGKTIIDGNSEERSNIYGIVSRMTIHYFNRWAEVIVDIFPTKEIRDLQDVTKRIKTISVQVRGDDFETYIATCADAGYDAMNNMEVLKPGTTDEFIDVLNKDDLESDEI